MHGSIEWQPPARLAPVKTQGGRRPRVSIVMPTFRRAAQIGKTLATLLSQTFSDFELLVRDDGSAEDGTEQAVLQATNGDPRVRYHRNPENLRMPQNLNKGIQETVGEYIAVCHDHDLFDPTYLATLVALLDDHPSALFAHCGIGVVDQQNRPTNVQHIGKWPELQSGQRWLTFMLQSFSCPVCALALVRRSAHERYGMYNPIYGFISDVELWMRLCEQGDVAYAASPLVLVRERELHHDASVNPWPIHARTFSIHRRYTERTFHGAYGWYRTARLNLKADIIIASEVASCFRSSKPLPSASDFSHAAVEGGPLMRTAGRLVSRLRSFSPRG